MIHARTASLWSLLCCLLLLCGCGQQSAVTNPDSPQEIRAPELVGATLPLAFVGTMYNSPLLGRYGTSPYSFALTSGSLPTGLSVSSSGVLSGNATAMGTYSFGVTLTDSETPAKKATQTYTVSSTTPLQVPGSVSIEIRRGVQLSSRLVSGGTGPYTSQIVSGGLPGGLVLNADGTVSGVPVIAAPFASSIKWTDTLGQTGTVTLNVLVTAPPLVASAVAPLSVSLGQSVMLPLVVQGGTPPYTFTLSSGALPAGVSLSSTGVLQGTPTAGGSYSGVVTVADGTIPQLSITVPVSFFVATASVVANSSVVLNMVSSVAYGVHTSVYDDAIGDISGEAPKIATAGAKVLRFPGGSYSDRYHWAQHSLTPNFAPFAAGVCATIWNGYIAANSDFGNFVRLLKASGTTGMVTVDYGSSVADASGTKSVNWNGVTDCSAPNMGGQPQEAAAWVAYANGDPSNTQVIGLDAVGYDWKTVGYWASLRASQPLAQDDGLNFLRLGMTAPVGIKYWEVGNELYYNGYNSILTETDLHAPFVYSNGYDKDPDSRQGVSALSPTSYGSGAAAFANAMHAVDSTVQVGVVVGSDIDPVPSTWTGDVLTAACGAAKFDFAVVHYYPGTYNAVTTDELLGNPQGDLPGIVKGIQSQTKGICGSSMPVFMTETNPNGSLASTVPDAAVALFAAHDLLTAFEAGMSNAEWLELHSGAGTFLNTTETPGSAYYGFQLAHLMADGGDALIPVTSSSSSLLVHAAKQKNGKLAVMLINRSATATAFVNVQGKAALANVVAYTYGPTSLPNAAALVSVSLSSAQAVSVAPLTAVVLVADE
jgi:hypothetical protein